MQFNARGINDPILTPANHGMYLVYGATTRHCSAAQPLGLTPVTRFVASGCARARGIQCSLLHHMSLCVLQLRGRLNPHLRLLYTIRIEHTISSSFQELFIAGHSGRQPPWHGLAVDLIQSHYVIRTSPPPQLRQNIILEEA